MPQLRKLKNSRYYFSDTLTNKLCNRYCPWRTKTWTHRWGRVGKSLQNPSGWIRFPVFPLVCPRSRNDLIPLSPRRPRIRVGVRWNGRTRSIDISNSPPQLARETATTSRVVGLVSSPQRIGNTYRVPHKLTTKFQLLPFKITKNHSA